MSKFDFKKEYKDLYLPGKKPVIMEVPEMRFIQVEGRGNPNTCEEYKNAMEILYGLSYGIKMSKMSGTQPDGYFDYVVPPLEGLWWGEDGYSGGGNVTDKDRYFDGVNIADKDKFCWISMIRQPDFVTEEVFLQAKSVLRKKKPQLELEKAKLVLWREGLCVQVMHVGPYDAEPETILRIKQFVKKEGCEEDFSEVRRHHEIYLGDPRRTAPERLKTVIRHPVRRL